MFTIFRLGFKKIETRFMIFFLAFFLASFLNDLLSTPPQTNISKEYEKYYEEVKGKTLSSIEFEEFGKKSDKYLENENSSEVVSSNISHTIGVKIIYFLGLTTLSFFIFSKHYRYKKHDIYVVTSAIFLGGIVFLNVFETILYVISFGLLIAIFRRKSRY
jgi:hypothetical protein